MTMLNDVIEIAREAGQAALTLYNRPEPVSVVKKPDGSPVTEADMAANAVIMARLKQLAPDVPIVSEEALPEAQPNRAWARFWLVDPIDGTRELIRRSDEFTVNIALIEEGRPMLGVLFAPALDECYWAELGQGAWLNGNRISNRRAGETPPVALLGHYVGPGKSRRFLEAEGIREIRHVGAALKFGRLARGDGDVYPRFSTAKGWDIAAGHIIAEEAGCRLIGLGENRPGIPYIRPGWDCVPFVAIRDGYPLKSVAVPS